MNENNDQNNQNNQSDQNRNNNSGGGRRKPRNRYGETIKTEAAPIEAKPHKESRLESVVHAIRPKREPKPLIADLDKPVEETGKPSRGRRQPQPRLNQEQGTVQDNRPSQSPRPDNRPSQSPRPDNRPSQAARPDNRPSQNPRPDNRPSQAPRPDNRPSQAPRPDNRPSQAARPDNRPSQSPRPDNRPSQAARPDNRPSQAARPDNRPSQAPRPDNRPSQAARPDNRPSQAVHQDNRPSATVHQAPEPVTVQTSKGLGTVTRRSDVPRERRPRNAPWNKPRVVEEVNYIKSNPNDKDIIRIMPLGGLDEIGKNMTAIEFRDEIIVIDCGLKFPEDDQLGIDSVIPDITFLKDNAHKVKGFFITHGHEDHIGALPHILKELNVPVYSTRLTLGLIENKLREHGIANKVKLNTVKPRDIVRFANISVEFIKTNHSIADASALAIHTAAGVLIHTGDFKVDLTPVAGDTIDLARFAQLGEEGVLALMADSTNAERPGYTESESTVGENFDKLFAKAKGRILVATFSSNIDRIQQVVGSALKLGRKVVFNGRSMENNVNVARELGYLNIEDKDIVPVDDMRRFREDQLVIMTTGSQGEPMAALSRMAIGEHRKIQIQPNDTVILSSHPIPGNEKGIFKTINLLYKMGAEVIYDSKEDVHVSGHACQEELKLIQALVKPKYFIPVHGEYRMLKIHSDLAKLMGKESRDILIPELGDVIELNQKILRKNGKVQSGSILVDGLGVGDVGSTVLRDRKHLSEDGMVTVVVTVDSQSGSVIAGPDLISRGFVFVQEADKLMDDAQDIVKKILEKAEGPKMRNVESVKNQIREELKNFLFRRTKRNPMIMAIIMEI